MDSIIGPIPQEFTSYITSLPNQLEIVPAVLYSTKTFTSASTTKLTFFDTAVSGGDFSVTNMQTGGQLPNPQSFLIEFPQIFIKVVPQSDDSGTGNKAELVSAFSDVVNLVNSGTVQIQINQKQYGPWPLWKWPCNSFPKGAFSTGSDLLADYGQIDGQLYPFMPKLALLPLQPFNVTMTWPTVITLSGATVDIQVLFDGKLARAV